MIDLKRLRKAKKLTQQEAGDIIGLDPARISRYENGKDVTDYITNRIKEAFIDYDSFLIPDTESESYNAQDSRPSYKTKGNILHIPQAAEAGFNSGAFDGVLREELETWTVPGLNGKCYSFTVSGESMMDTLRSGELIITSQRPVQSYDSLVNDYLYVVHLKDGIKVKRIGKHSDPSMLWLFSDNEDYDDEEINVSEIINIYQGRRIVSFNLSHKMRYE